MIKARAVSEPSMLTSTENANIAVVRRRGGFCPWLASLSCRHSLGGGSELHAARSNLDALGAALGQFGDDGTALFDAWQSRANFPPPCAYRRRRRVRNHAARVAAAAM